MNASAPSRELRPFVSRSETVETLSESKRGELVMGFELDGEGRSVLRHLYRRAPIIVQQALYFDEQMPEMPCVYILSAGGPNIDGDRYSQTIEVGRGAYAHISTGAATKLAEMEHDYSSMVQRFTVEAEGYLEYLPEPTIPCRHTRFSADTLLRVDPTATVFYAEIYTCGRKHSGERFDYDILSVANRVERLDSTPLFREKFVVAPSDIHPCRRGVMGSYDHFANVVVVTPKECADRIYNRTEAFIDRVGGVAAGVTRLPEECGLQYKVLGNETEPIKRLVRTFCSVVRQEVKGRRLFDEFPWR